MRFDDARMNKIGDALFGLLLEQHSSDEFLLVGAEVFGLNEGITFVECCHVHLQLLCRRRSIADQSTLALRAGDELVLSLRRGHNGHDQYEQQSKKRIHETSRLGKVVSRRRSVNLEMRKRDSCAHEFAKEEGRNFLTSLEMTQKSFRAKHYCRNYGRPVLNNQRLRSNGQ